MVNKKQRFEGGRPYYHRQGSGASESDRKALGWDERKKQMDRSRRKQILVMVGSLVVVISLVVATFLLMTLQD